MIMQNAIMNGLKFGRYAMMCAIATVMASACCNVTEDGKWTKEELEIIESANPTVKVYTIADQADSLLLRSMSKDLGKAMLQSTEYAKLADAMIATVTSPEQDGVGIAGPQVGILRRIVAVQRLDKEGEPFEVYPNIRITEMRGQMQSGPEGCLSVPGRRGNVMRSRDITISYTSPSSLNDTTEVVQGFTAVIFQHETDHLDGTLYIDKTVE